MYRQVIILPCGDCKFGHLILVLTLLGWSMIYFYYIAPWIDSELFIVIRNDNAVYTFGSGTSCDIVIQQNMTIVRVDNLSQLHCGFTRVKESTDNSLAYLDDHSFNGTFLNGVRVRKGKKKILVNGDDIFMAWQNGKVFTYFDPRHCNLDFPAAITNDYVIVHMLGKG